MLLVDLWLFYVLFLISGTKSFESNFDLLNIPAGNKLCNIYYV